jgi:hypothetical protein
MKLNAQTDMTDIPVRRAELAPRGLPSFGLLIRLAVADLWHERILTSCVIVALTAVLAPLLLLLSLKYGLVETLRSRLVNDPRNREIRPQTSEVFTLADVETLRHRPDVRFVIPQTRSISTSVRVSLPGTGTEQIDSELLPTGEGDPLLEDNGTRVPEISGETTECVLSEPLHRRLSAGGKFAQIKISVSRQSRTGFQTATATLNLAGVVTERATSRETVFVSLDFLEEIEHWLEGHPVPRLKWEGESGGVLPVVEEIIVPTTHELEPAQQAALVINTGFSAYDSLSREEVKAHGIVPPEDAKAFYRFITQADRQDQPADSGTLKRFRNSLPPVAGDIFGYCRPMSLDLSFADGRPVRTALFRVQPEVVNQALKKPAAEPVAALPPVGAAPLSEKTAVPGETVQPAVPVRLAPNGLIQPLPMPSVTATKPETGALNADKPAGGMAPLTSTPGLMPGVVPPPSTSPVIQLDKTVQPLPRPVPPPSPPKAKPVDPGEQPSKDSKPDTSKSRQRRKVGGEQTGLFSPEGGRFVMASLPAPVQASPEELNVILPQSWNIAASQSLQVTLQTPSGPVTFPATVKLYAGDEPMISQSLAGRLRVGMERPIEYQSEIGSFITTRRGWPSFRLVARDINSVQGLVDYFHSRRMNVITKAERIRDVRELDQYTNKVFWLIAGVGLTGAVGALLASLIAAVERKRRSLGVLRLLGLRRRSLVRLPFYQSAIIVSISVGLAIGAWWWVSDFIKRFTLNYLEAGEHLATLPREYLLVLWGCSLLIAAIASLIAGVRVMGVDPSEAIRDE